MALPVISLYSPEVFRPKKFLSYLNNSSDRIISQYIKISSVSEEVLMFSCIKDLSVTIPVNNNGTW